MKAWNAPEMEELDVRMTLNGHQPGYTEDEAGFKEWGKTGGIMTPEGYETFLAVWCPANS